MSFEESFVKSQLEVIDRLDSQYHEIKVLEHEEVDALGAIMALRTELKKRGFEAVFRTEWSFGSVIYKLCVWKKDGQLTNETYKEIKEKLQILDILYDFIEDSVYGWNPKKETWGWIEFNLDIEKDDNCAEEKKKLQEWIIKTHKEKQE